MAQRSKKKITKLLVGLYRNLTAFLPQFHNYITLDIDKSLNVARKVPDKFKSGSSSDPSLNGNLHYPNIRKPPLEEKMFYFQDVLR